jgi:hypothetical protein
MREIKPPQNLHIRKGDLTMAAKRQFAMDYGSASAEPVVNLLADLAKQPAHKWIPIEEIRGEETATVTPRQANWLQSQIAKKLHGVRVEFLAVESAAEPTES